MADNNLAKVFAAEDFNPEKCECLTHILLARAHVKKYKILILNFISRFFNKFIKHMIELNYLFSVIRDLSGNIQNLF